MKKISSFAPVGEPHLHGPDDDVPDRDGDPAIGSFIREVCKLTDQQVETIVEHHRKTGTRFGDAAIALDLATKDDVLWALSQQFHYPYAFAEARQFGPELVVATEPFGERAEAFRELRSQMLMGVLAGGRPRPALSILSVDRSDGKSYVAANIAIALSQLGARTLLIDANMQAPCQHQLFKLPAASGLSSILSGRASLELAPRRRDGARADGDVDSRAEPDPWQQHNLVRMDRAAGYADPGDPDSDLICPVVELPGLYVLGVGTPPPNPRELIQRPEFTALLRQARDAFEYVIVDTPAAALGADAQVIAHTCGAALLVARRHRSAVKPIQKLTHSLSRIDAQLAGVLINEH